jgi:hypothetical protein
MTPCGCYRQACNFPTQFPSLYRWDFKVYTGIIGHFMFPRIAGSYVEPVKELPDTAVSSHRRAAELHRLYYQKLRLPRGTYNTRQDRVALLAIP